MTLGPMKVMIWTLVPGIYHPACSPVVENKQNGRSLGPWVCWMLLHFCFIFFTLLSSSLFFPFHLFCFGFFVYSFCICAFAGFIWRTVVRHSIMVLFFFLCWHSKIRFRYLHFYTVLIQYWYSTLVALCVFYVYSSIITGHNCRAVQRAFNLFYSMTEIQC